MLAPVAMAGPRRVAPDASWRCDPASTAPALTAQARPTQLAVRASMVGAALRADHADETVIPEKAGRVESANAARRRRQAAARERGCGNADSVAGTLETLTAAIARIEKRLCVLTALAASPPALPPGLQMPPYGALAALAGAIMEGTVRGGASASTAAAVSATLYFQPPVTPSFSETHATDEERSNVSADADECDGPNDGANDTPGPWPVDECAKRADDASDHATLSEEPDAMPATMTSLPDGSGELTTVELDVGTARDDQLYENVPTLDDKLNHDVVYDKSSCNEIVTMKAAYAGTDDGANDTPGPLPADECVKRANDASDHATMTEGPDGTTSLPDDSGELTTVELDVGTVDEADDKCATAKDHQLYENVPTLDDTLDSDAVYDKSSCNENVTATAANADTDDGANDTPAHMPVDECVNRAGNASDHATLSEGPDVTPATNTSLPDDSGELTYKDANPVTVTTVELDVGAVDTLKQFCIENGLDFVVLWKALVAKRPDASAADLARLLQASPYFLSWEARRCTSSDDEATCSGVSLCHGR